MGKPGYPGGLISENRDTRRAVVQINPSLVKIEPSVLFIDDSSNEKGRITTILVRRRQPKDGPCKVQVTNSELLILKSFVRWLEDYCGIPRDAMKLRLHLWEGSDELIAKKFWAEGLGIPFSNFTKTWFKPRGTKNSHPNGVCRVSVSSKSLMETIRSDLHREFQSQPAERWFNRISKFGKVHPPLHFVNGLEK